ncbi:MAG: InlB B-repeat-containing protein, partial [Paludibacteraceae bacterium]|nr:InlB B-repeat-containing protein [Paludibacteraceae bacterium]
LNGRIVGHDGNLVISAAHPQVMAEENADLLSIEANSTPISLNGKHFTAKHRVRVLINTQNTAVSCGMFVINNAWFEATGQKPVVDCQNSMIQNASITSGSLKNDAAVKIEPNIQKYVLFLMKNIDEAGVVTGDGYYPEGTQVTITAIPNEGYKFLRWDDGEEDQQRYVTMNQDIVLTAIFEADVVIPTYTVNVVSADETMGTVSGGGTDIPEGTVINITATPNSGYQFLYWTTANGQVQGKKETWTVTKDETLTAHFRTIPDPNDYLLWVCGTQVSASNSADILGDGVWCYDHDSRTLTTMKDATYNLTLKDFVQDWITDAGPLTMVVNHNITVTTDDTEATSISMGALLATKGLTIHIAKNKRLDLTAKNMYPLQANGTGLKIDGHGRVDVTLQNTNDKATTAMLLSGTPSLTVDGAWMFVNVPTGCKVSNKTDDNLSVLNGEASGSMSGTWLEISDQTPRYSVNVTPSYNMDLCVYQGAGDYFEGEIVTLRALPATGYKFVAWSDGNTDNPRTFTMPAEDIYLDPIVTEDTEIGQKGAIINANATEGQGTITGFESGWYAEGTELTITAVAAEGYEFVEWSDGKTENPYLLTVVDKQNVSITACFKAIEKEEGVENVQGDDVPCTKVLREGVLYIERNGKIYNAQGAKVK